MISSTLAAVGGPALLAWLARKLHKKKKKKDQQKMEKWMEPEPTPSTSISNEVDPALIDDILREMERDSKKETTSSSSSSGYKVKSGRSQTRSSKDAYRVKSTTTTTTTKKQEPEFNLDNFTDEELNALF